MDVLTEETLRTNVGARSSRISLYSAALAYAVLTGAAVLRHEPWADEAQSWLIARDASLFDLWTRLLHYEGTPGLWQTLLHCLIRAGLPYGGMNVLSGLLGFGAACLLIWRAPFPLAIRVVLPFTYYLAYQYAVIARSYDLLALLLFCCAAIYPKVSEKPLLFTLLLCLMAAVSVHGMLLALAIGFAVLVTPLGRQTGDKQRSPVPRWGPYMACFAAIAVLLAICARPAPDGTFITGFDLSLDHMIETSGRAFAEAFTGEWISSLAIVALSVPLLWRGGGWLFFVLSGISLCAVASLVYSQVWHHGILFLAWLFAVWISANQEAAKHDRLSYKLALVSLAMVTIVQCYWTVRSVGYDWGHAYSGSQAAAQSLGALKLEGKKLDAIGFACIAIEPYFPHNIFANVNDGRREAYWDWSSRNHVNQDSRHVVELRPDYVIVGYKNESERGVWTDLVRKGGYRAIRHFEGNTFWRTRVFEPESYDLFERSRKP